LILIEFCGLFFIEFSRIFFIKFSGFFFIDEWLFVLKEVFSLLGIL